MHFRTLLVVPVALALALGVFALLPRESPVAAPSDRPSAPATAEAPQVDAAAATAARSSGLPSAFYRKLAPGETVPLTLPSGLTSGIRCPDGTFLPLLNGVPYAGAISRTRQAGPLPPVVAKTADQNGLEWYVHADGSRTTTHWATIEVEGEPRREVLTRHVAPLSNDLERSSADGLDPNSAESPPPAH